MNSFSPPVPTVQLVSEIFLLNHVTRNRLVKFLPDDIDLSHFLVLLHLSAIDEEIGPAALASAFNVTRGAMSNTLGRLERTGRIDVRGDKIDARRKHITLSARGQETLDKVFQRLSPKFELALKDHAQPHIHASVDLLAHLRKQISRSV